MVDSTGSVNKANIGTQQRVNRNDGNNVSAPTSTTEASSSTVDSVALTQEAQDAIKAAELFNEVPAVDEKKIADIKKALSEGNYPLDSQRTADNMMALENLLTDSDKN
jgi:negative regulator of flagellin synthesis FlgM